MAKNYIYEQGTPDKTTPYKMVEKYWEKYVTPPLEFAIVGDELIDFVQTVLKIPLRTEYDPLEKQQISVGSFTKEQHNKALNVAEETGGFITQYRPELHKSGNPEHTLLGSKITRGFSMAGSYGTELSLYESMLKKGYRELYYDAPYHWGVINVPEKKIFTYTEGDTALIECNTYEQLLKEAQGHIDFLIEQGYSKAAYGEWEEAEKKIKTEQKMFFRGLIGGGG